MKVDVSRILQKLIHFVTLILFHANHESPEAGKVQERQREISQPTSLRKCYYCNGTGLVEDSPTVDRVMSSRLGDFSNLGWGSDGPLSACPVCKGTGRIET